MRKLLNRLISIFIIFLLICGLVYACLILVVFFFMSGVMASLSYLFIVGVSFLLTIFAFCIHGIVYQQKNSSDQADKK